MKPPIASLVKPAARRGFTLLEMCIVLFIIALLAAAAMPAMTSAFNERSLRDDSHGFSVLVKTAMLRSSEDQRPYVLTLDGKELALAPAAAAPTLPPTANESAGDDSADPAPLTQTLGNALKFPDAVRKDAWEPLPTASWTFQPNGLCPLPRLRFERGSSYVELSFNALTGNVEDEAEYIP